uniref:GRIP domain-containing protein n=1 Tax=Parastrongyloides trichosuri TaxID=131310 RepID=A0A0N5A4C5_PARTI
MVTITKQNLTLSGYFSNLLNKNKWEENQFGQQHNNSSVQRLRHDYEYLERCNRECCAKRNLIIQKNLESYYDVDLYKQKIQTLLQAYKEQEDEKRRLQTVVETLESVDVGDDAINKLKNLLAEGEKQRLKKEKVLLADRKGLLDKYNESRKELKLIKEKVRSVGVNIDDNGSLVNMDSVSKYEKHDNKKDCSDNGMLKNNKYNNTTHLQNLITETKKTFETDSKLLNKKIENLNKINNEKDSRISILENANEMSNLKVAELANENASYREKIINLENEIAKIIDLQNEYNSQISNIEENPIDSICSIEKCRNNMSPTIITVSDECQTNCLKPQVDRQDKKIVKESIINILMQLMDLILEAKDVKLSVLNSFQLFKDDVNNLLYLLMKDVEKLAESLNKKHSLEEERLQRIIKEQREEIDLLKKYSEMNKIKFQHPVLEKNKKLLTRKVSTTSDFSSLINDKTNETENNSSLTNSEESVLLQHYAEQLMKKEKFLESAKKEFVLLEQKYNECLKEKLAAQMDFESQKNELLDEIRNIRGSNKILQVNDFQYIRNVFTSYLNTRNNDLISRRNILRALGQVLSLSNVELHKIDTFK